MATTITTQKAQETETPTLENKVFIRNLAYKTTKKSLIAFAETAGKVVEATVAKRNRRSLGFGFITFSTESEATKAITELDKKELDGRVVHLELARPHEKAEEQKKSAEDASAKKHESKKEEEPEKKEAPKKKEVSEKKEASKKKETSDKEEESTKDEESNKEEKSAKAEKKPRKKQSKKKKAAKKTSHVRAPSKTTLFVANLPYATVDDDLKKIFSAYKLVSAQVSRMKNGRSKGYGFVEFETEEDQLKAFETVKDINLEGRAVYLKIALSGQDSQQPSSEEEQTNVVAEEEANPEKKKEQAPSVKEEKKSDTK